MPVSTAVETLEVYLIKNGARCVINKTDFDESVYSLQNPSEKSVSENPLRRKKVSSSKGE